MTRSRFVGIGATAALVFSTAAQAVPKHTKQESTVEAKQSELTKPSQRKEEKSRPTLQAQDVFGGIGEKLKAVTDSQIKVLQKLIDNTSDDAVDEKGNPEKPDYLFRMAELFAEQEHYYNFRARELDQKIFDAAQANKQNLVTQYKAQQVDFEKREVTWRNAAVKEYLLVTNNAKFNGYKRMDQVLFYLAFFLTQQKREDLARPFFKRLIKDYPNSQFIADAYLSFGEYYFEQKDIENALKFYDKVLQFPQSRVFGYAQYKEGWCYFNLQDYKKALEIFVKVVSETKIEKKDANKIALIKEAKKDIVRAYSQIDAASVDKAWPFFQKYGNIQQEYAPVMLEMLGEMYNAQGKFDNSIKVYRQLMKNTPGSLKLCNWQQEILKNTLSKTGSRATGESVQELERLAAVYDKYKGMDGVKKEALEECRDNTAGSLRELATTWHKEAQKTNVKETYALAQSLYREYIEKFPKEKDVYPMTFYYGELLFKLERFCESAPVYTSVVKLDTTDKAKYRNEAAYAAVISWKNCLGVDDSGTVQKEETAKIRKGDVGKDKSGKGKEKEKEKEVDYAEKPIPEKNQKMLDAFETYIKYVPNSPELVTIKYRKARTLYEYNHFKEASPLFKDIAQNHQDSDLAVYSANLRFDCDNVLKDIASLEADTKLLCPAPKLAQDADFHKQCETIQANIGRMYIESAERSGDHLKAAELYIKLANDHPDDPKIAEVLFNAAINYDRAKAYGRAIKARQDLIEKKPDDPLAKKAVFMLGKAFQSIAAYGAAADHYEKYAIKYPGEKEPYDAATALFTASFFRRGLGEIDKSIEDTNTFIRLYSGRKEYEDKSAGVYFGLGQIYEAQKNREKLEKHLKDYIKTWREKGGIDREIIATVKLAEMKWADSCTAPDGGVNGACLEIKRVRASSATRVAEKSRKSQKGKKKKGVVLPAQCGPETKSKIVLYERKPAYAKEAQALFQSALKLYAGGAAVKKIPGKDEGERNARAESMMYAVAQAKMMEGDQDYERLIAMKIPDKLDFTPADLTASKGKIAKDKKRLEDNTKKFKGWYEGKIKAVDTAQKAYQQVILYKQAHWAIAAAARIGQVFQDFSGQLYTAPVPKAGKSPEGMTQDDFEQLFHDSYCDQMTDTAEPLETKAVEGLKTCLDKSTDLSWFNEWSALCEAELNQIKPAEYPLAAEIRAVPGYSDKRVDAAPLLTELK
ncbi:MAG: tetratricopeptide repeat protein [Myxococcales bacterium]|nr:tetratricopeptide repeat protein [Myxococcales bacterium]